MSEVDDETFTDQYGVTRTPDGKFVKGTKVAPGTGIQTGKKALKEGRVPPRVFEQEPSEEDARLPVPAVNAKLRRLNQRFVDALYRDFQNYGEEAIEQFRQDDPGKYVQLVASFIPKEQTLNVNQRGKIDHTHEYATTIETTRFLGQLLKQQRARETAVDIEVESDANGD